MASSSSTPMAQPEHSTSKWLQQKSYASKRFSTAEAGSDVASKRICTQTTTHNHSEAVTLCMRGLNIQWPFSQLLLMGVKLEEVRAYALDYRGIAKTDEEVWIVETKGHCAKASANAILTDIQIASRPAAAQIVGTIRFACSQPYYDKQAFHEARCRHRIKAGSLFDWDDHHPIYGWRVDSVRALTVPINVGRTGQTGFEARGFSVVFANKDKDR